MKMHKIAKLGLMMLVLLVATGAAAASGGSSYNTATEIEVPDEDIDCWSGSCRSTGDWYKFEAEYNDNCYIDLQKVFTTAGGSMKLYDGSSSVEAWVATGHTDHYASLQNSYPRILIKRGTKIPYQFIAGRNTSPP